MPKIKNSYGGYTQKPKIEVSDNAFKITLPNTNFVAEQRTAEELPEGHSFTDREETVLRTLARQDSIGRKDVQEILQISQATAILLLREMTGKRLLVKIGNGRLSRYKLGKIKAIKMQGK